MAESKGKHGGLRTTQVRVFKRDFERLGWQIGKVEQNKPNGTGGSTRHDLWGFADYLMAHRSHKGAVLVQLCARTGVSVHLGKACSDEPLAKPRTGKDGQPTLFSPLTPVSLLTTWILAGNRFWIVAYEKDARGNWTPTVFDITLAVVRATLAGKKPTITLLPRVDGRPFGEELG